MNTKRALGILTLFGIIGLLVLPVVSLAVDCGTHQTSGPCIADPKCLWNGTECKTAPTTVVPAMQRIGNWMFYLLTLIAAIVIIVGGIMFAVAGGSEERTGTAKNLLIYGLVGVGVAVLAKGLVAFVQKIVGG